MTAQSDADSIVTPTTSLHLAPPENPWYRKTAGVLFLAGLVITMLLLGVGNVIDRVGAAHNSQDLRTVARELKTQNDELTERADTLKRANDELKQEQECRAQRSADLAAISSRLTGEYAKLTVLVIQQVRDPDVYNPILNNMSNLAEQRARADELLVNAVAECQVGG